MPYLLEDPRSAVLDVPISRDTASLISRICALLTIDSLEFAVLPVLKNVQRCLKRTIDNSPFGNETVSEICDGISSAIKELTAQRLATPGLAGGFFPPHRPALRVLSTLPEDAPDNLLQTIGQLLIISWLTDLPLPKHKFENVSSLCRAITSEPKLTERQAQQLKSLLTNSSTDLLDVLKQHGLTQDKSALRFNTQLSNHLRSGISNTHLVQQHDVDMRRFASSTALSEAVTRLKEETIRGDADALITLLGVSLNLHWELLCQIPLNRGDQGRGHLLWVDVLHGVVHIDLRPLLRDLGQPIAGCEVTSDTLRLQLPRFVADQLRLAWTMRPSAKQVGDLTDRQVISFSTIDDARSTSFKGKLLRSAPSLAIRLTNNRAVAAYGFLAFQLVDHSDLPYINISEEQVWELRAKVFEAAGLGEPVKVEDRPASHLGSARTVLDNTTRDIFLELDLALAAVKVGKNYNVHNLIEFHNRYTCRVGMFMHFVAGARATEVSEFLASSWLGTAPFGYLNDKRVGIAQGHTPIPVSPSTRNQLKLWRQHITSLQRRLSKKLGAKASAINSLITSILTAKAVPLFFLLDSKGTPKPLRNEYLFTGQAANINRDWGRHFMASRLTAIGRPLSELQILLRHQGGGINPQSADGIEVLGDRCLAVSLSIESILHKLDIRPTPGLSGAES